MKLSSVVSPVWIFYTLPVKNDSPLLTFHVIPVMDPDIYFSNRLNLITQKLSKIQIIIIDVYFYHMHI